MDAFSKDMLRFGTLQGFACFTMYLRGREELLLTVRNHAVASEGEATDAGGSMLFSAAQAAVPPSPARICSPDTNGKPPASPAGKEHIAQEDHCVFLIGAYQRYKSPFVWLRSGKLDTYVGVDFDVPMKLKSTQDWANTKSRVWDVVAELVALTVQPRPRNPFAVNFQQIELMHPLNAYLGTAAMLNLLREIVGGRQHPSDVFVLQDMQRLVAMHFEALAPALACSSFRLPHLPPAREI
mmetsp:Transcript_52884/g.125851  ORF Transcript_52884/g.125851 Transcript_52884/m.125851 type:complete len:239 (+) Transcript_52884:226-942(+)